MGASGHNLGSRPPPAPLKVAGSLWPSSYDASAWLDQGCHSDKHPTKCQYCRQLSPVRYASVWPTKSSTSGTTATGCIGTAPAMGMPWSHTNPKSCLLHSEASKTLSGSRRASPDRIPLRCILLRFACRHLLPRHLLLILYYMRPMSRQGAQHYVHPRPTSVQPHEQSSQAVNMF